MTRYSQTLRAWHEHSPWLLVLLLSLGAGQVGFFYGGALLQSVLFVLGFPIFWLIVYRKTTNWSSNVDNIRHLLAVAKARRRGALSIMCAPELRLFWMFFATPVYVLLLVAANSFSFIVSHWVAATAAVIEVSSTFIPAMRAPPDLGLAIGEEARLFLRHINGASWIINFAVFVLCVRPKFGFFVGIFLTRYDRLGHVVVILFIGVAAVFCISVFAGLHPRDPTLSAWFIQLFFVNYLFFAVATFGMSFIVALNLYRGGRRI